MAAGRTCTAAFSAGDSIPHQQDAQSKRNTLSRRSAMASRRSVMSKVKMLRLNIATQRATTTGFRHLQRI